VPDSTVSRLKIGLSACFQHADPARPLFTNKTLQYVEQSIAHWIMSAGAMVVMVPCPTGETARGDVTLAHYAEWLDGVVMHGGADVWPGNYGEEPLREEWMGDRVRDLYDLAVVKAFAEVGKPIFGVCRGCSSSTWPLAARCTRTSRPSTPAHCSTATPPPTTSISTTSRSCPTRAWHSSTPTLPRARVNSIHHQGIKRVAPDFVVEA
jgi:putative glutamine amidotransferase